MNLAHKLLDFFYHGYAKGNLELPYSLMEFVSKYSEYSTETYNIGRYCRILEQEGLLLHMGTKGSNPYYRHCYYTNKEIYDKDLSKYGSYDLLVNGFYSVRERFSSLCLPISVKTVNDDYSIGSCFIYDNETVITARHCIEGEIVKSFQILDIESKPIPVENIYVSSQSFLDVAIIKTQKNYFESFESFVVSSKPDHLGTSLVDKANFIDSPVFILFGQGKVLDNILTLGYPPISGFESILIADKSAINSVFLRSSVGQVLTQQNKIGYWGDDLEYFLINAKVKGGNSGGPVFDNLGRVIGIVVEIPVDIIIKTEIDKLGYGLVVPAKYIKDLMISIKEKDSNCICLKVQSENDFSYSIKK